MRFRPAIALLLAYSLTLASVLGALTSASVAGTDHYQLCITSAESGKPLPPAHSDDLGLCCFVANGGNSPALITLQAEFAAPVFFRSEKILHAAFGEFSEATLAFANPRAPPAKS